MTVLPTTSKRAAPGLVPGSHPISEAEFQPFANLVSALVHRFGVPLARADRLARRLIARWAAGHGSVDGSKQAAARVLVLLRDVRLVEEAVTKSATTRAEGTTVSVIASSTKPAPTRAPRPPALRTRQCAYLFQSADIDCPAYALPGDDYCEMHTRGAGPVVKDVVPSASMGSPWSSPPTVASVAPHTTTGSCWAKPPVTASLATQLPRLVMPQLRAIPRPGSKAARLPRDSDGKVDVTRTFLNHLRQLGIRVDDVKVPVHALRPSQAALDPSKLDRFTQDIVSKLNAKSWVPRPVVVSNDLHLVDGHHHVAAARRLAESTGLAVKLPVHRVSLPIGPLLDEATHFSDEWGMPPQDAYKPPSNSPGHTPTIADVATTEKPAKTWATPPTIADAVTTTLDRIERKRP